MKFCNIAAKYTVLKAEMMRMKQEIKLLCKKKIRDKQRIIRCFASLLPTKHPFLPLQQSVRLYITSRNFGAIEELGYLAKYRKM